MRLEKLLFWKNLERIKATLLLSDKEFANFLGLTYSSFIKKKKSLSFLPVSCIFELSEKLNFHFEDLLKSSFDLDQLIKNTYKVNQLPDKYSFATFSQTRPIINIINYIEKNRGLRAKINLLRKFQISESLLLTENIKTNIFLISDIAMYLQKIYQFTNAEFYLMGQQMPFASSCNFLKTKLSHIAKIEDTLECFFSECTHLFDTNCDYKIEKMENDYAIITATPCRDVLAELKISTNEFGNEAVCASRMGVISSISWFKFKQFARVEKITSINNVAMSDRYLFNFSAIKNLSSSGDFLSTQAIYH